MLPCSGEAETEKLSRGEFVVAVEFRYFSMVAKGRYRQSQCRVRHPSRWLHGTQNTAYFANPGTREGRVI